jgi:hypothetical protein
MVICPVTVLVTVPEATLVIVVVVVVVTLAVAAIVVEVSIVDVKSVDTIRGPWVMVNEAYPV